MDFQNRAGGKTGSGGVASFSESNRDRRERLRQLALETIDLNKVRVVRQFVFVSVFVGRSTFVTKPLFVAFRIPIL